MPITYDSGTNTITVIGFSEAFPCTFEDIYNASVTNGWGVVDKPTDNSYVFEAKLVIGDSSTWTYFADKLKTVMFKDIEPDWNRGAIEITRHAYFWIGEGDEATRTGYDGCIFLWELALNDRWVMFIYGLNESDVRLYGSIIQTNYGTVLGQDRPEGVHLKGTIARVWSCYLQHIYVGFLPESTTDANDVHIIGCPWVGMYPQATPQYLNLIFVEHCDTAVYYWAGWKADIFNGVFLKNNRMVEWYNADTIQRLTDCESDNWNIIWSGTPTANAKLERAYTLKIKVTDKDGNSIQNALVELYDKNSNLVFAELTNSNGETSEHSIVSITYTPTETIDNNPYTVKITKDGYTTLEVQITIDRTMKNLVWQLDALDYTLDNIYNFLKGSYGILNRETMHKTGSKIKVRFKSKSGDKVKIYVYKPDGAEVVNIEMAEIGNTGIYYYDLTFYKSWGVGDFLVKCVDVTDNIEDAMTITILSEDDWFATHSDIENIKIPKVIEL
ncbi:MAG: carboxypeptidase-like regulatory domain-containing protein [Candidatus Desulfofervidus auxilii]|nr:carboxypeptidase-like regulatory domain-containing protein [Candidatus Desulfofervidus auxilii]